MHRCALCFTHQLQGERIMAKIIKQIIGKPTTKGTSGKPVECNYSNNYYGDQVCRPANPDSTDNR